MTGSQQVGEGCIDRGLFGRECGCGEEWGCCIGFLRGGSLPCHLGKLVGGHQRTPGGLVGMGGVGLVVRHIGAGPRGMGPAAGLPRLWQESCGGVPSTQGRKGC